MRIYDSDGEVMNEAEYKDDAYPYGYCQSCGTLCQAIVVDEGIGYYEYGSAVEFDSNKVYLSPCCEAEVLPNSPKEDAVEE